MNIPPNGSPYTSDPASGYLRLQRTFEKRRIKRLSWGSAAAVGGYFLLYNILYALYALLPSANLSIQNETQLIRYYSMDLLLISIALLLPFSLLYWVNTKYLKTQTLPLGKPSCGAKTETLILIGALGLVLLSSNVTSYLNAFVQMITGAEFLYAETPVPASFFGSLIYYVRLAVFPALVEEFAMRGVVMQPLRRWGDTFAIFMSALVFALMHGNMVQAPFALLAGFILGYAAVRTGSLWTSIVIHLLNNTISLTLALIQSHGADPYSLIYNLTTLLLIVAGVICTALLLARRRLPKPAPNRTVLPNGDCYKTFILTVPMVLVLLYMLSQTLMAIKLPWLEQWFGGFS